MNTTTTLLILSIAITLILCLSSAREKFTFGSQFQDNPNPLVLTLPEPNLNIPEEVTEKCYRCDGSFTAPEQSRQPIDCKKLEREGFIPELKLTNAGPIEIEIHYRPSNSKKYGYVATIPSQKSIYVYKDSYDRNFLPKGILFSSPSGKKSPLYFPLLIEKGNEDITFGAATTDTEDYIVTFNLIGEIGHIKFRNFAYATYSLYYNQQFVASLPPARKDVLIPFNYTEFYSQRSGMGYRLGGKITILMEGTDQPQAITLNNNKTTVMNIGTISTKSLT